MVWDISVGEVSGLIATGIFLLQVLVPLSLPVLLVAFVSDTNSAVTWSSLGRFLHTSLWPSILRTDTAASTGVKKSVSLMGYLQLLALGLISLASIITPLGLYDVVTSNGISGKTDEFRYINDSSPFGIGTPARSNAPFTRQCGNDACPGGSKTQNCQQKGLAQVCNDTVFDRSIPSLYTRLFTDGATSFSPSLSSIFDLEWRSHYNATDAFGSLGWGLKSAYRQMSTLILEPKIHVVEGLIVNTKTGGIGFRNHTVPKATYPYGSTWTEDLLFIEPTTKCVDLNFTFNFHLENKENTVRPYIRGIYIKDAGGLSHLSRKAPVSNLDTPSSYNGQGELSLQSRALNAAWLNNYLTLLYYNLTNPDMDNITRMDAKPGMKIQTNLDSQVNNSFAIQYQSIRSNTSYGDYLDFTKDKPSGANPFNVTLNHFSKIVAQCNGAVLSDPANLNSSLVGCGILYGAAQRTDGGDSLIPDPGSRWALPVFSCASSISATVKTVTFKLNGTSLSALQVVDEEPKKYAAPSDMPLWAVENMEWPRYNIGNAQPLWGIVGTANTTLDESIRKNITTISQESLRLPGLMDDHTLLLTSQPFTPNDASQNLPGVNFYTQALRSAFSISMPSRMSYGDYSGQTQFALYAKWQKLSVGASSAAEIINLVWTDIAANAVVGTKGWGLGSGSKTKSVSVTAYHKQVRFKMPYSVPAFVVIGVCIALLVSIVVLIFTKKTGLTRLRFLIDATSAGRNMGISLWPAESNASTVKTKDWVETIGLRDVTVLHGNFVAVDDVPDTDDGEENRDAEVHEQTEVPNKGT